MADLLTVPAEVATLLQLAAMAAPREHAAGRRYSIRLRREAYMAFQRASQDLVLRALYLRGNATEEARTSLQRLTHGPSLLAKSLVDRTDRSVPARWLRILSDVAATRLAFDLAGDLVRESMVRQLTTKTQESLSEFMGELMQVRLVGAYEPRCEAENIVAVLGEIFGSMSFPHEPVRGILTYMRRKQGDRSDSTEECLRAIGELQRRFTLAAQMDLGRRRWHLSVRARRHKWQLWRVPTPDWPGGWPGPDGKELVADLGRRPGNGT